MQDKVDYPYLDYSFVSLPKVLDLLPHFFLHNTRMWKWKWLSGAWLCDPMDYTAHGIL